MKKLAVISGIYKIVNLVNGHVYIGESYHCLQRKRQHLRELKKNRHSNSHLQRAWNKYGKENFKFIIIETCPENIRYLRERYWIAKYQANIVGYNQSGGGEGENGGDYSYLGKCCKGQVYSSGKDENGMPLVWMKESDYLKADEDFIQHRIDLAIENSIKKIPVVCITTGKSFESIKEAGAYYDIPVDYITKSINKGTLCKAPNIEKMLEWKRK